MRLLPCLLLLTCCASQAAQPDAVPAGAAPPTGATIGPSGFATILSAPPVPHPDAPPPSQRGESEPERLARAAGISVAEAESRMNPDMATRNAAIALRDRLTREAAGNFVDVKIVRDPLPRFVFHFRRDAAATLARFTSDPRFAAVEGGVPGAELQPLLQEWFGKLSHHRLVSGGSIDPFEGVVEIHVGVSRSEYEAIAAREGWRPPPRVRLFFAREVDPATVVAPDAAPFIRTFPRADRSPGAVHDIAIYGRIVLRDGCFRVDDGKGGGPLALFGRDTRLLRDEQGYLVVASVASPTQRARIGEKMVWGGYPTAVDEAPGVVTLRAQCGNDPIASVGAPTSASAFRVRPWAIDDYAQTRGISRQRAWEEIKACWAREDAPAARVRGLGMPPPSDCDSIQPINPPPPPRR